MAALANVIRFGLVGTGRMARVMAGELRTLEPHGVAIGAVCSRDRERGRAFAAAHGIGRCHLTVDELACDPEIDAVYIATPPALHAAQAIACLENGKAVLCEKPFALDAGEARRVVSTARARRAFLMEAMWTRFLPAVGRLRELVRDGRLGALQLLIGGGAFIPDVAPGYYLFDSTLGGGALLDAGVYLVSLASMCLGLPTRVMASAELGRSGVDENDALLCDHRDGAKSLLYVSLRARRPPDLELLGATGRARLGAPVFRPTELTITIGAQDPLTHDCPIEGSGYGYQLVAMVEALRRGETEHATMSLDETLGVMEAMDAGRRQWLARDLVRQPAGC